MYILGISAFYHDSAACLIKDGEILAATQEERFTRKKHDACFPYHSILFCLEHCHIAPDDISYVVFYEKPFIKFERLLETYLAFAPKGFRSFLKSIPLWLKEKLFQKKLLIEELSNVLGKNINWSEKILFSDHHLSHAASAFYPSPFERAAVLTIDGVGEWTTTSVAVGSGKSLKILKEIRFPHSLGLLYSAFTYYTGFKVNSGEYKVMGLAPYGVPRYVELIKNNLINIADDGSFQLDMSYFNYATGLTMTNSKFNALFGGAPRNPESPITQREMDIAASIQKITEEIVIKLAKAISIETGEKNLCMAGGVALNCVANGALLRSNFFENIWIQPAAGDAGGAIGAALVVWWALCSGERVVGDGFDGMNGSYLGPEYSDEDIEKDLISLGAVYHKFSENQMLDELVDALVDGQAAGWMQGRMEFGPRALGARSIIADPRSKTMQKQLNLKVKFRESFRPFAPSVLSECVSQWFSIDVQSPYMLFVAEVIKNRQLEPTEQEKKLFGIEKLNVPRSGIPAVTHVDYSARIQTVHLNTNKKYHLLIDKFYKKTGCPILVNTSFNVRGEPIVCNPKDAFNCFMGTGLDILAIGNFLIYKNEQNHLFNKGYKQNYELD